MVLLIGLLRFVFNSMGVALLVAACVIAYRYGWSEYFLGVQLGGVAYRPDSAALFGFAASAAGVGPLAMVASHSLRRRRSWAWRCCVGASLATLLLPAPWGVALAVFGLWVCFLPQIRAEMASWRDERGSGAGQSILAAIAPLAAMVTFAGVAWWTSSLLPAETARLSGWGPLLWLLAGASTVEIIAHELGHVFMGVAVGMRFHSIAAGPLVLSRLAKGWSAGFNPFEWDGGWAGAVPRSTDHLRADLLAFAAGGPLASLLMALVALWTVAGGERTSFHGWEPYAAWLAASSSAGFVFNVIPCQFGGFRTDGAWITELLSRRWSRLAATFAAQAWLAHDTRPSLWPTSIVTWLTSHRDQTMDHVQACHLAALHYFDRNEYDRGSMYLEEAWRLVEFTGSAVPPELALERAYVLARFHGDPDGASALLEQAGRGQATAPQLLRVRAAIAVSVGNWPEAALAIEEAAALVPGGSGLEQYEKARLEELGEAIAQHSAGSAKPVLSR